MFVGTFYSDQAKLIVRSIPQVQEVWQQQHVWSNSRYAIEGGKHYEDKKNKENCCECCQYAVVFRDDRLRPGTEKDEETEANTVGLTTLKCENLKCLPNNVIELNFLGKSSIQFVKKFKINEKVYTYLKSACANGKANTLLFPSVNATSLNAYLASLSAGLSAKVFRTYKASSILQEKLMEKKIGNVFIPTVEKKEIYDQINKRLATS